MSGPACLSVIVPAFNEQATIVKCLQRVLAQPFVGEVIVVDDGSTDGTSAAAQSVLDPRIRLVEHPRNRGKGASIRSALGLCTLEYVAIQDADLEYDPIDLGRLLEPLESGDADVVFGSRFLPYGAHRALYFWHSLGNKALTLASNVASDLSLSDMETCYKVFRRDRLQLLVLEEDRFGIEPELTIKAAMSGLTCYEVGISYRGRTYEEGKKIRWPDGVHAARCIAGYGYVERKRRSRRRRFDARPDGAALVASLENLKSVDNYYDWIVSHFERYLGERLLEVGAGIGTVTGRLAELSAEVVAIEPAESAYAELALWARDRPHVTTVLGRLEDVGPVLEPGFDLAVMVNVLEHVESEVSTLATVRSLLNVGGHAAIWVPAHEALYSRYDRQLGHFRRYSKRRLRALAEMAGLEVVEIRYVNPVGALGWFVSTGALGLTPTDSALMGFYDRHVIPLSRALERTWRPPFGQSALLIARRAT